MRNPLSFGAALLGWPAWLSVGIAFFVVIVACLVGFASQPWYPWWVSGGNGGAQPPTTIILGGNGTTPGAGTVFGPAPGSGLGSVPAGRFDPTSLLMQVIRPWLGVPYFFGGCSHNPGIDCSCFTQIVMGQLGVSLPRTAQTQWNATARTSAPQVGDLVFFSRTYDSPDFITHVGIYLGSGQMVSAAQPAVGIQSLSAPYWQSHLAGFGQIRIVAPGQA